jgi:hypothetical protein
MLIKILFLFYLESNGFSHKNKVLHKYSAKSADICRVSSEGK